MTETDLSTWLVGMEAAMRIGCSTRTIERLAAAKKLEQRLRPQAGSPAVAVYNPDDVSRLAAERRPAHAPFVLAAGTTPPNGNGHRSASTSIENIGRTDISHRLGNDPIRQLAAAFERFLLSPPSPSVSATVAETKLFLTLREASALSGLSQAYLRRQVQAGTLAAVRDRGWRIRRTDLEAL